MSIDLLKKKFTTGAWLNDVKQYFTKINELIVDTNANTVNIATNTAAIAALQPVPLIYKALISQTGTNAPTVDILENTLGTIVYTYDSQGNYTGTLAGAFPTRSKASLMIVGNWANAFSDENVVGYDFNDANSFYISSGTRDNANGQSAPYNDVLYYFTITIEVYP